MEINDDALNQLFGDIAKKLEDVDRGIRQEYTGRPAAEIEPVAAERFAAAGLNLTGSLRESAESVERNEPFTIELG